MAKTDLTAQRLRELLHYDPETGVFTWRVKRSTKRAGAIAGRTHHSGYQTIMIDRCSYTAHRLAWLYVSGDWCEKDVDHINCVKSDNRICNLREATRAQNTHNRNRPHRDGTSAFLGVSRVRSGMWKAQITEGGRYHYLGIYKTGEEAHAAYVAAKRQLHPFGNL